MCLSTQTKRSHVGDAIEATSAWLAPEATFALSVLRSDDLATLEAERSGFDFRLAAQLGKAPDIVVTEAPEPRGLIAIRIFPVGHRPLTALALQPAIDGLLVEASRRDSEPWRHIHLAAALAAHTIARHVAPRSEIGARVLPLVARIAAVAETCSPACGSTLASETERGALAGWAAAWVALATADRTQLEAAGERLRALAEDGGRLSTPQERARLDLQRSLVLTALGKLSTGEKRRQYLDVALSAALDARDALTMAELAPDASIVAAAAAIAGSAAGELALAVADPELLGAADKLLADAEALVPAAAARAAIGEERARLSNQRASWLDGIGRGGPEAP